MRKRKVYLGKPYRNHKVPSLLRQAAINAYALVVGKYVASINEEQILLSAPNTGKSTTSTAMFKPVSHLNALNYGLVPVTFALFATKQSDFNHSPVPHKFTVCDMDIESLYWNQLDVLRPALTIPSQPSYPKPRYGYRKP